MFIAMGKVENLLYLSFSNYNLLKCVFPHMVSQSVGVFFFLVYYSLV